MRFGAMAGYGDALLINCHIAFTHVKFIEKMPSLSHALTQTLYRKIVYIKFRYMQAASIYAKLDCAGRSILPYALAHYTMQHSWTYNICGHWQYFYFPIELKARRMCKFKPKYVLKLNTIGLMLFNSQLIFNFLLDSFSCFSNFYTFNCQGTVNKFFICKITSFQSDFNLIIL